MGKSNFEEDTLSGIAQDLRDGEKTFRDICRDREISATLISSIGRQFKKRFGLSPTKYREAEPAGPVEGTEEATGPEISLKFAKLLASTTMNFSKACDYLELSGEERCLTSDFQKAYDVLPNVFQEAARKIMPEPLAFTNRLVSAAWPEILLLPAVDSDISKVLEESCMSPQRFIDKLGVDQTEPLADLRQAHFLDEKRFGLVLDSLSVSGPS